MTSKKELESAAKKGDINAISELAVSYFKEADYKNSEKWALKGAEKNDGWCLHILGTIARGQQNMIDAEKWYAKNVDVNQHSMSASNLGFMYLNMEDNPKMKTDVKKAEKYFKIAFQQDDKNGEAAFGLAMCNVKLKDEKPEKIRDLFMTAYQYATGAIKDMTEEMLKQAEQS